MNNLQDVNLKRTRSRQRCYSSMNYQQYECYFGTPPKMPQAPNTKPQEDPLDIPFLALENQATEEYKSTGNNNNCKIQYIIDVIPQVDSSDANSIGFQSPHLVKDFFQFNLQNKVSAEQNDSLDTISVKRSRTRPRSYSENSPLIPKMRIIDFLNSNKSQEKNQFGRKQVKLEFKV